MQQGITETVNRAEKGKSRMMPRYSMLDINYWTGRTGRSWGSLGRGRAMQVKV